MGWPETAAESSSKAQKCRDLARSARRPEVASALLELATDFEAEAAACLRREDGRASAS